MVLVGFSLSAKLSFSSQSTIHEKDPRADLTVCYTGSVIAKMWI